MFRFRRQPQIKEGVSHFHIPSVYKFLKYHHITLHLHTFLLRYLQYDPTSTNSSSHLSSTFEHVYSASKTCESLFLPSPSPRDPRLTGICPRETFSNFTALRVTADMTDIKFGRSKIPEKDLVLYYYARTKFTFGGRSFTREECNDLISWKMKPKPAVVAIQHDIYDIFDDDTHEITKSLEKHAQNHEASLHSELEEILQSLLGHKDSENFRDRMEKLSGLSV